MLHPRLSPKATDYWKKPASLEAWQTSDERTVKLDVLAQLVKHHLEQDGQRPLTMGEDGKTLVPKSDHSNDTATYPECDRIVVYAAFPSSNQAILDVSTPDHSSWEIINNLRSRTRSSICMVSRPSN